jgi:hypothetical protein
VGNPIRITSPTPHGLRDGDQVLLNGFSPTSPELLALNGRTFLVSIPVDPATGFRSLTSFNLNGTTSAGTTSVGGGGGFWWPTNQVLLKASAGAPNLSGLSPADQRLLGTVRGK